MSSSDENHPGPPCVHAPYDVASTDDSLPHMIRDFAELGDVYRVIAPGRERGAWVVSDPDTIKRVLVSNHRAYTIGVGLDRVKVLVGNGIIVSEGEVWKRQHRMVQHMFQRSQIDRFGVQIAEVNLRRLQLWSDKAQRGEAWNVTKDMSEGALEMVLRATLGPD